MSLLLLPLVGVMGSSSSSNYPKDYFKYTDTSMDSGYYKSYRLLGCTIGPNVNEGVNNGSQDNGDDDFTGYASNSACAQNDSGDSASWTMMANCRRAQIGMEVHGSKNCGGQSKNIMTTTGVYAFAAKHFKLTGATPFNSDAIAVFKNYETCTSRSDGTYEMLSCDPDIPGNYVVGKFSDSTCFVQTAVLADLKDINYLINGGRASKNFGNNKCDNLDQKYGDYGDMDVISAISSSYYDFGPIGAIVSCGMEDSPICSSSSGTYDISASKMLDYAKYGLAYVMFGAAALVVLATFEVVHKRRIRKRKKIKNRRLSVSDSASDDGSKL